MRTSTAGSPPAHGLPPLTGRSPRFGRQVRPPPTYSLASAPFSTRRRSATGSTSGTWSTLRSTDAPTPARLPAPQVPAENPLGPAARGAAGLPRPGPAPALPSPALPAAAPRDRLPLPLPLIAPSPGPSRRASPLSSDGDLSVDLSDPWSDSDAPSLVASDDPSPPPPADTQHSSPPPVQCVLLVYE